MDLSEAHRNVSRESVAAEVRAELARARYSGRSAAFALGWTQAYMSRRLNADMPFDVDDLAAIAGLLGIPVTRFFQGPGVNQLRKQLNPCTDLRKLAVAA